MNKKQLVSMWCGIGLILFVALTTVVLPSYPDYVLFVFWVAHVILVTVGLIGTFRTKIAERNRSREMNLRKGFKRLVFILSLVPVLLGIVFIAEEAEDSLTRGSLIILIGFVAIWTIYGVVLYIIDGFNTNYCANCEIKIGKIEELFKFKEHVVCAKCHKKLIGNEDEGVS